MSFYFFFKKNVFHLAIEFSDDPQLKFADFISEVNRLLKELK